MSPVPGSSEEAPSILEGQVLATNDGSTRPTPRPAHVPNAHIPSRRSSSSAHAAGRVSRASRRGSGVREVAAEGSGKARRPPGDAALEAAPSRHRRSSTVSEVTYLKKLDATQAACLHKRFELRPPQCSDGSTARSARGRHVEKSDFSQMVQEVPAGVAATREPAPTVLVAAIREAQSKVDVKSQVTPLRKLIASLRKPSALSVEQASAAGPGLVPVPAATEDGKSLRPLLALLNHSMQTQTSFELDSAALGLDADLGSVVLQSVHTADDGETPLRPSQSSLRTPAGRSRTTLSVSRTASAASSRTSRADLLSYRKVPSTLASQARLGGSLARSEFLVSEPSAEEEGRQLSTSWPEVHRRHGAACKTHSGTNTLPVPTAERCVSTVDDVQAVRVHASSCSGQCKPPAQGQVPTIVVEAGVLDGQAGVVVSGGAPLDAGHHNFLTVAAAGSSVKNNSSLSVDVMPCVSWAHVPDDLSMTDSLGFPVPDLKLRVIPYPCPCHPLDALIRNKAAERKPSPCGSRPIVVVDEYPEGPPERAGPHRPSALLGSHQNLFDLVSPDVEIVATASPPPTPPPSSSPRVAPSGSRPATAPAPVPGGPQLLTDKLSMRSLAAVAGQGMFQAVKESIIYSTLAAAPVTSALVNLLPMGPRGPPRVEYDASEFTDGQSRLEDSLEDAPEDAPVDATKDVTRDATEHVPEDVPVDVSDDVPVDVSEDVPVDVSEDVPVDVSEDVPKDVQKDVVEDVSEDVPDAALKDAHKDVPEDVPVAAPEAAPEDEKPDEQDAVCSTDSLEDNVISVVVPVLVATSPSRPYRSATPVQPEQETQCEAPAVRDTTPQPPARCYSPTEFTAQEQGSAHDKIDRVISQISADLCSLGLSSASTSTQRPAGRNATGSGVRPAASVRPEAAGSSSRVILRASRRASLRSKASSAAVAAPAAAASQAEPEAAPRSPSGSDCETDDVMTISEEDHDELDKKQQQQQQRRRDARPGLVAHRPPTRRSRDGRRGASRRSARSQRDGETAPRRAPDARLYGRKSHVDHLGDKVESLWVSPWTKQTFPSSKSIIHVVGEGSRQQFKCEDAAELSNPSVVGEVVGTTATPAADNCLGAPAISSSTVAISDKKSAPETQDANKVPDSLSLRGLPEGSAPPPPAPGLVLGLGLQEKQADTVAAAAGRALIGRVLARAAATRARPPFALRSRKQAVPTPAEPNVEAFECRLCADYLAPPVRHCAAGHGLCPSCLGGAESCPLCGRAVTASATADQLVRTVLFPCKNSGAGCKDLYWIEDRARHEARCPFRPRPCPYAERSQVLCPWSGLRSMIRGHMRRAHGHHGVVYPYRTFFPLEDFNRAAWTGRTSHVEIVFVEHEIFELHKVFDERDSCLWGMLRHILARDTSALFSYTIRFQPANMRPTVSFRNDVMAGAEDLAKALAQGKRFAMHLDCFTKRPVDVFSVQLKVQPRDRNKWP
ncbi:E3 ubiquitin-protein ligase sina [Frankliniella fusca]|uniref:RING-type E3 ubiquitin transferase n=1 Tax=Frankliniella fusca TaxID=407009 RepID=A0AAE1GTQ7_9NEOP|nr:E3 ubiquitin-protein ligase sina [Frankliniella fusca]